MAQAELDQLPDKTRSRAARKSGFRALRLAFLYAVAIFLWLACSEPLFELITSDQESLEQVRGMSGILFIAFTSIVVYWLEVRAATGRERDMARRELASTRDLLNGVLDSMGEAAFLVSADGYLVEMHNPVAEKIFGYGSDALTGKSLSMLHPNDDAAAKFVRSVETTLAQGQIFRGDYDLKREDGVVIDADVICNSLSTLPAWKDKLLFVVRDITPRKSAERELKLNEARFRKVVESLPVAVFNCDKDCRITLFNAAAVRILGTTPEIGRPLDECFDMLRADGTRIGEGDGAEDRVRKLTQGGANEVVVINRPDASRAHVLFNAVELEADHRVPRRILCCMLDISELRQLRWDLESRVKELNVLYEASRRLMNTEAPLSTRLQELVNLIPDATPFPEAIGARIIFQKEEFTTPGFTESQWVRTAPISRFGKTIGRIEVALTQAPPTGVEGPLPEESQLVESLAASIGEVGKHHELARQYQQAQKLDSIGRLAGGVAHDFNNLLGVIMGYTQMTMMRLESDEEAQADLLEVISAAEHAASLTGQLLAFSRKEESNPVPLNFGHVVEDMRKMLGRLVGEDIRVSYSDGDEKCIVNIDPNQVHQIMANLAVNARDAIEGMGWISIEVAAVQLDDHFCSGHPSIKPGPYALLTFSDSGSGMTKETIEQIYEPFFTTKAKGEGTGLGMSTVYGIVSQNAGLITVYSEVGHGTTFRIYFPRTTEENTANTPTTIKPDLPRGSETILLVEDDARLLVVSTRMIEDFGYHVLRADSPEAAIALAQEITTPLPLLITDVVMPDMNGLELYQKIKNAHPEIRCIFVSGYTADIIVKRGVLPGSEHFLQKPIMAPTLAKKIREVLDE